MRVIASLLSALALSLLMLAQTPPAAKSGTAAPKKAATTVKKTGTATKKAATGKAAGGFTAKPGGTVTLTNDEEKTLYAIGMYFRDVQEQQLGSLKLNPKEAELVKQGLMDALTGTTAIKLDEWGPKIQPYAQGRMAKANEEAQKQNAINAVAEKAKGAEYATKAAAEPGATKLASGVIYRELTAGDGDQPKASDTVKVHYKGTLIDGTEFDSSYKRNEPAEFPLSGVIPCWTEGVQKMKVKGKAKLTCPYDKAYGDAGRPPQIPGGATLVFEVELLEIAKPEAGGPPQN